MSTQKSCGDGRIDRRTAIKWMLAAASATALMEQVSFGATSEQVGLGKEAVGYGTDPDLLKIYQAGDLWPLTLTGAQRATTVVLCDLIIPADDKGPKASSVGVPDFVDEWISAPYLGHARDRTVIARGLAWLDDESRRRFGAEFIHLRENQQTAICDDLCDRPTARPEFQTAAQFFARFRFLVASGYYTTREGMSDIGYRGNVPLAAFDGPPKEVLERLGLA